MGPTRLELSKPVIAAVEGFAVAGGLELAIWCDLRVAAAGSAFGVFCRRFGVPLVDGGTVRLPRLIGQGRALDLILSGREVGADEALAMGLVNRVVPDGTALDAGQWPGATNWRPSPRPACATTGGRPLDQWGLSTADAMVVETRLGLDSLASPEAAAGAGPLRRRSRARRVHRRPGRQLTAGRCPTWLRSISTAPSPRGAASSASSPPSAGRRRWSRPRLALAPRLVHAALAGGTVADRTKELLFERVLAGVALDAPRRWRRVRPRSSRPAPALRGPTSVRLAPRARRPGGDRVGLARSSMSGRRATGSVPTEWSPPVWPSASRAR